jgi:DNA-binding transcriptional MerR regulator
MLREPVLTIGEFAQLGQVSPRTLRHYGNLGLLTPAYTDPATGYRSFEVSQLLRLNRILALRDLGFGLDQIAAIVTNGPSVGDLRELLERRRAEIEITLSEEHRRLRRVESRLRLLDEEPDNTSPDVVRKQSQALTVAVASGPVTGFGNESAEVIDALRAQVREHLIAHRVTEGPGIGWYDIVGDQEVRAHIGFVVGQHLPDASDGVRFVSLPAVEVAAAVHGGRFDEGLGSYQALARWAEAGGYDVAGPIRVLYLEYNEADPDNNVVEIQLPIRTRVIGGK